MFKGEQLKMLRSDLRDFESCIAVGDRMFLGCKILILPKPNQICSNLKILLKIKAKFEQNF